MPDKLISELELTETPSPIGDIPISQDGETYRAQPKDFPVSAPVRAALDEKADVNALGSAATADVEEFATAQQGQTADTAVQPGDLSPVATSGDYADLDNKPSIPAAQVNADWNASSGVSRILNKPTLGSAASADTSSFATAAQGVRADSALQPGDAISQLTNDAGYISNVDNKADLIDGKVPASQLPSYVDDVLDYPTLSDFPATGEADKIYITHDTNLTYRWSGSAYVEISQSLALGETSSSAYRGDRGKAAYDHTTLTNNPHSVTASQVGLGNVNNTSDASKPVSSATQTALNQKLGLGGGTVSGPINTTAGGAAGLGTQSLASSIYIQSRGQNLITNGTGLLRNNYNFSQFTFDGANLFAGNGSFKRTGAITGLNDELIPVDPSRTYELTGYVRETTGVAGTRFYLGIAPVDADGNGITAGHHMRQAGTDTTLAADLKPGDTVVYLTSAANWNNAAGASGHLRQISVYGHANSAGYTYPNYTYTRRLISDAWADGAINFTANTITLKNPWPSTWGTIPAGTAVSNGASGSTYKYIAATGATATQDWVKYTGKISGIDYSGTNDGDMFPVGTANVRILIITNYMTGTSGGTQNFSNLYFGEIFDQPRVSTVATTASFFPNADEYSIYTIPAQATTLTIQGPIGNVKDGDRLMFRIRDNGVARFLTFNAIFKGIGVALPNITVAGKWMEFTAVYNASDGIGSWHVIDVRVEGESMAVVSQLDAKANFPATNEHVPFRNSSGSQTSLPVAAGNSPSTIVIRNASNQFSVGTPTASSHATSKQYVDDGLAGKADTSHTHTASNISDFATAADARISAAAGTSIATLSSGKVPASQLPAIAMTDVFLVANEGAQLALTAEEGDVAIRTDLNKTFIHNGGTAGTMADWSEMLTPTDAVSSVNGSTGAVVLTQDSIGDGSTYKQYSLTEKNKLASIEDNADVTEAANVSSSGGLITVINASTTGTPRPSVSGPVLWIDSVEPTDAIDGDVWWETP